MILQLNKLYSSNMKNIYTVHWTFTFIDAYTYFKITAP